MLNSQITIFLDDLGSFHCEIPQGPIRRKIALPSDKSLWGKILSRELESQSKFKTWNIKRTIIDDEAILFKAEKAAEKAIAKQQKTHLFIWDTTARTHHYGSQDGIEFATKILGKRNKTRNMVKPPVSSYVPQMLIED